MSDLTSIAEYIRDAMQAIDEAHNATDKLREDTNHVTLDTFHARMLELQEHMSKLLAALDNEDTYIMDELVDALSQALSGHRAEYRRTPRLEEE